MCACGPGRHDIQLLFFSPCLHPDFSAAPHTILSFLEISPLASMTPPWVLLRCWPGCSPHDSSGPGGEWRMKPSVLCSPSPVPQPGLRLLLPAPPPDSHKDAVLFGRLHCQVSFPSHLFSCSSHAPYPGPVPERSLGIQPSLSVRPPWAISTTAMALRAFHDVDTGSGSLPGAPDNSFQFPG